MKKHLITLAIVIAFGLFRVMPVLAQWEGVGKDYTPGDSRVPTCLHEKDGYIFFGDDHVGVFRIKEPVTDTSEWVHFAIPGMNVVFDLITFDGKLWCTSDGNGVFSSDDNGEHWMDKSAGLTHHKVYALAVCNNMLFCGTYHGGIFRYDNGTGIWAAVNSGFSYDPSKWYALELTSIGNTLYLYTVGIGMWYSDNFGEGWHPLNNIHYDGGAEVHDFIDHGGYLMIPADYLGVMRSVNGGQAWDFCNEGMTSQLSVKSMAATQNMVFVGTSDSGVFLSRDNGDHWEMANLGLPWDYQDNRYATVYSMEVYGDYLYIGMWFNGVMRARLDDMYAGFFSVPPGHKPGSSVLSQNYPNPFTSSTRIIYRVTRAGPVTLKVYDPFGKEVATLVDAGMNPGEYQAAFDAGGLPAGIYCCRLQAGKTTGTSKMILTRP